MATYTPTIGLEIHAELKTQSKMFCGCPNAPHDAAPNEHVCPICMGHPGTLPAVNGAAVKHVLTVGVAVDGVCAEYTEFDRKNYFYPDIPKGYQISQYAYPLVSGGELAGVSLTRIHLEEDTARSQHEGAHGSLIDYNRAGVPLMELVTEPVIHDAEQAGTFARELQLLLRALGVSDANMERGEMRVEVNISISADAEKGTKVEIKNLNSFKSVEQAIAYEIKRQSEVLENGEKVIQETRGWDEIKGKTISQRKKESSHDYRYFPDPDIPKVLPAGSPILDISRSSEIFKNTPSKQREILTNLGIPRMQGEILITNSRLYNFYKDVLTTSSSLGEELGSDDHKRAINYITSDILGELNKDPSLDIYSASVSNFMGLMRLLKDEKITSRVAKDILKETVFLGMNPESLIQEKGLMVATDEGVLAGVVDTVLKEHTSVVSEYKEGKEAALQFLIGQCMKKTKGSADPKTLTKLIKSKLS